VDVASGMSGRKVITERHIQDAVRAGASTVLVPPNALITPLARDAARAAGIVLSQDEERPVGLALPTPTNTAICIGSDHGGFDLKKELISHLEASGKTVLDLGTDSTKSCDYPDFAYAVARTVSEGKAGTGIMIDGVGVGSSIVCNKVPGIRAACAYNEFAAWNARAHNNCNVLTLGSRSMGVEVVKRIVDVFLSSEFEGGRHERRVQKITDVEERFSRK
jgi:ribose 5-phosphate isomerase B